MRLLAALPALCAPVAWPAALLARDGSTNELALLVAEYRLLGGQLRVLAEATEMVVAGSSASLSSPLASGSLSSMSSMDGVHDAASPGSSALLWYQMPGGGGGAMSSDGGGEALSPVALLERLALEIPDMRARVGVK